MMDAFQSTTQSGPTVAIKPHNELNSDLIGSRDSTHHGYAMLSRTDRQLVVVHRLSYYQAPMGLADEVWHQKELFAFTRDVAGNQMLQTINWPTQALQILPCMVKVSKIADQITAITPATVEHLPTVALEADPAM
jgi:hypothetical protein